MEAGRATGLISRLSTTLLRSARATDGGLGIGEAKCPERLLERALLLTDREVQLVPAGADGRKLDRAVWSDGDIAQFGLELFQSLADSQRGLAVELVDSGLRCLANHR